MCTTYIASKLVDRFRDRLIGYPRLVRLNPNIKYKTRGNGALAIQVGEGAGSKIEVGHVHGTPVFSNSEMKKEQWSPDDMEKVISTVEQFSESGDNTNPGIVFSRVRIDPELYINAVRKEIEMEKIEKLLKSVDADFVKFGSGRGIIGAASAISWTENPHTFEVLNYSFPAGRRRSIMEKMEISNYVESTGLTFDSIDKRNRRPAIFPREKTPVVYGIRGMDPDSMIRLSRDVNMKFSVESERTTIFKTNQGTDDHIVVNPPSLENLGSYAIDAYVLSEPYSIRGGHYFLDLGYNSGRVRAAAFEPTKEFRSIISRLRPGDMVRAFGSFVDETINLEKIRVSSVSEEYGRTNPKCKRCGIMTTNRGRNDFRCPSCGARYSLPEYVRINRNLTEGYYEVPVTARRHLSMPLKLRGTVRDINDMY